MEKFNFIFWGTPLLASQTLDILAHNGYFPCLIITTPDAPAGRGLNMQESPVGQWARKNNIKCLKPEKIDQKLIDELKNLNILLSIVVAYGKILPEKLIQLPSLGTINIHFSILPKYRGASPIEASILNGDSTTGVSIQQMVFKLDCGPILARQEVPINISETKEDIKIKLTDLGGNLLCEILPNIINKKILPEIQNESQVTYCTKINKKDGEINFNDDPLKNYNKYRAFYGWPGVYFFILKNNKLTRIKITKAVYENNSFLIKVIIPEGKKEILYENFLKTN